MPAFRWPRPRAQRGVYAESGTPPAAAHGKRVIDLLLSVVPGAAGLLVAADACFPRASGVSVGSGVWQRRSGKTGFQFRILAGTSTFPLGQAVGVP